jgi:serine protease Do
MAALVHPDKNYDGGGKMKKKVFPVLGIIVFLLASLVTGGCTQETATATPITEPPASDIQTTPKPDSEQPLLPSITDAVAKVKPSVVAINVDIVAHDIFGQPVTEQAAGSGWIIDQNGYIVTNNHVVEGAENVTVTLDDGRVFSAATVRTDPLTDLAVVKVDAQNLPAVSLGDSAMLSIGDWVVAVGNSLGMGTSATQGIVSALEVSLAASPGQTLLGLIQTDAAINPGNSGGPLVNLSGEVVGINSIKIAEVGVEGMGYAISINEAMPIIQQLIQTGYVVRPWLGIGAGTVDQTVAMSYGLAVDKGVLVASVVEGSPASQAGLMAGDVITALDGQEIDNLADFVKTLNSDEIGQTVEITYFRGSTQNTTQATLAESPIPEFQ